MMPEYEVKCTHNVDEPGFGVYRRFELVPTPTTIMKSASWTIVVIATIEDYFEICICEGELDTGNPIYLSFDGDPQPDGSRGVVEFDLRRLFSDPSRVREFVKCLEGRLSFRVPGFAEIVQEAACDEFAYFKREDFNELSAFLSFRLRRALDELGFVCLVLCIAFQLIAVTRNVDIGYFERILGDCDPDALLSYESVLSAFSG